MWRLTRSWRQTMTRGTTMTIMTVKVLNSESAGAGSEVLPWLPAPALLFLKNKKACIMLLVTGKESGGFTLVPASEGQTRTLAPVRIGAVHAANIRGPWHGVDARRAIASL